MKLLLLLFLTAFSVLAQYKPEWINYTNTEFVMSIGGTGDIIWFGTSNGLVKYNKVTGEKSVLNKGNTPIPSNVFFAVKAEDENTVWFGTANGIVKHYDNNWIIYNTFNTPLLTNWITSIAIDKDGTKWFGTDKGLVKFDNTTWTSLADTNLSGKHINSIAVDSLNRVWVGTPQALVKIINNIVSFYNKGNSPLLIDDINALACEDSIVWIGTHIFGRDEGLLYKFDGITWQSFNFGIENVFEDIIVDSEKNKWVIVRFADPIAKASLFRIDSNNQVQKLSPPSYYHFLNGLYLDNNILWLGTDHSARSYDGTIWETTNTLLLPINRNNINEIKIDKAGRVWINCFLPGVALSGPIENPGTVIMIEKNIWKTYSLNNSPLHYDAVSTFDIDDNGIF